MSRRGAALDMIEYERSQQDFKFGTGDNSNERWLVILMEEVGEVAKAMLEGSGPDVLEELVQVAAVALAWLEHRV